MNNLDQVLDQAMALPANQQEMLVQILQGRIVDRRREEMAQDAEKSLAEFRSGKTKSQTADEVIADLRTYLESDQVDD
jgi:hypothetical protein